MFPFARFLIFETFLEFYIEIRLANPALKFYAKISREKSLIFLKSSEGEAFSPFGKIWCNHAALDF